MLIVVVVFFFFFFLKAEWVQNGGSDMICGSCVDRDFAVKSLVGKLDTLQGINTVQEHFYD